MEQKSITVEVTFDKLQEAVKNSIEGILKSSYGNPIKDTVEKAIKEKGSEVEVIVKQIIAESMSNPDFKVKLGEVVMGRLIESIIKK